MTTLSSREVPTSPTVRDGVDLFLEHKRNANLSLETLRTYNSKLLTWITWRKEKGYEPCIVDISLGELRAFFAYLRDEHEPMSTNPHSKTRVGTHLAPATIAIYWSVLRNIWNFWAGEEFLTIPQLTFFVAKRLPRPKVPEQTRPTYEITVLDAMLAALESPRAPSDALSQRAERAARDRAILLMLWDTGMRAAELCSIDEHEVNDACFQARVMGKGQKPRFVYWTSQTQEAVDTYRAMRRGGADGPMFRGVSRTNDGGRLTPDALRQMVQRTAKRAAQKVPKTAPVHALRHTFAHRFLDKGGDGLHLQQLMGHESITTTQRYVRENPTRLRHVYRKYLDPTRE